MTYELALKLKNAGFPQYAYSYSGLAYMDEIRFGTVQYGPVDKDLIYIPTTAELIRACTEINHEMTFHLESIKDGVKWWAEMRHFGILWRQVGGATPEEAVANLYLAINQK